MPQAFIPTNTVDMSKEKDWPANLGMMDWDNTKIVFTKRSLMEFLKYVGVTVDPNFFNISKLPRYVEFGKLGGEVSPADLAADEVSSEALKTSGRVTTARAHTDIFAFEGEGDALSLAPPKDGPKATAPPAAVPAAPEPEDESGINFPSSVRPSRRVRDVPGGKSSIGSLWDAPDPTQLKPVRDAPGKTGVGSLWDAPDPAPSKPLRDAPGKTGVGSLWDAPEPEQFKPGRRVTQRPGEQDGVGSLWS